jgi:hypothetical protein
VPAGATVHFLKVDVEGFEKHVLESNDWQANRPWIIVVEAHEPNTQIKSHQKYESILFDSSYQFVYADGLNRFYLASEHARLISAFEYPPNFFDHFTTAGQARLEDRLRETEARIEGIYQSFSWKLTGPLRRACAYLSSAVRRSKR